MPTHNDQLQSTVTDMQNLTILLRTFNKAFNNSTFDNQQNFAAINPMMWTNCVPCENK